MGGHSDTNGARTPSQPTSLDSAMFCSMQRETPSAAPGRLHESVDEAGPQRSWLFVIPKLECRLHIGVTSRKAQGIHMRPVLTLVCLYVALKFILQEGCWTRERVGRAAVLTQSIDANPKSFRTPWFILTYASIARVFPCGIGMPLCPQIKDPQERKKGCVKV